MEIFGINVKMCFFFSFLMKEIEEEVWGESSDQFVYLEFFCQIKSSVL